MRDPKMILVIEEERQAAVLEIDRLRAVIANLNERSAQYERDSVAKDARIAHEEAQTKIVLDSYAEENQRFHDRAERAEARVAELEAYHTNCTDYINGLLGNMADDDKERVAILARAEQAEARLGGYLEVVTRAERAEARVAELEAKLADMKAAADEEFNNCSREEARAERAEASYEQQVIVAANYAERAERAEAEVMPLKIRLAGAEAQRDGLQVAYERAEAEVKVMREALKEIEKGYTNATQIARAALAPPPAGREG